MTTTEFHIRPARDTDLADAIALLVDASLPTADLTPDQLALVARRDRRIVGVIGLERRGALGLLRSLVVAPRHRASGVGRQLVDALEGHAAARGVTELWLLTTDAQPFFARLGYARVARAAAPGVIAATRQFTGLCHDTATLMAKTLSLTS